MVRFEQQQIVPMIPMITIVPTMTPIDLF